MRRLVLLSVLVVTGCDVQAWAIDRFDAVADGWTLDGDPTSPTPTLSRTEGNPAGCICGTDAESPNIVWYFKAPWSGDASKAYGRVLTFELKARDQYQQVQGRDVELTGGGLRLLHNHKIGDTPGLSWTPYRLTLDESSGWYVDPGHEGIAGDPPSKADFMATLKGLTSLRIRGEFKDGPDSACLDNVVFGFEP